MSYNVQLAVPFFGICSGYPPDGHHNERLLVKPDHACVPLKSIPAHSTHAIYPTCTHAYRVCLPSQHIWHTRPFYYTTQRLDCVRTIFAPRPV